MGDDELVCRGDAGEVVGGGACGAGWSHRLEGLAAAQKGVSAERDHGARPPPATRAPIIAPLAHR